MAQGLNAMAVFNEGLEMLKKEGKVVWGYILTPPDQDPDVFCTHELTGKVVVEGTAAILEATYPEIFGEYMNGELDGTVN